MPIIHGLIKSSIPQVYYFHNKLIKLLSGVWFLPRTAGFSCWQLPSQGQGDRTLPLFLSCRSSQLWLNILAMINPNYIQEIQERARLAGFNMAEVCREAGIDQAAFSRWKRGTTVPLVSSMQRLRDAVDRLIAARLESIDKIGQP